MILFFRTTTRNDSESDSNVELKFCSHKPINPCYTCALGSSFRLKSISLTWSKHDEPNLIGRNPAPYDTTVASGM